MIRNFLDYAGNGITGAYNLHLSCKDTIPIDYAKDQSIELLADTMYALNAGFLHIQHDFCYRVYFAVLILVACTGEDMRDGMQHLDILPVKRTSIRVKINGKVYMSIKQASRMTGEEKSVIHKKLKKGEKGYIKIDS